MRLYLVRDRHHQPNEDGGVVRAQFVTTINAAQEFVRPIEIADRPRILVQQLELPTAQAELTQVLSDILRGEIPLTIVRRTWCGTRRGGLQENVDGEEPVRKPRASCKRRGRAASAPAPGTSEAKETADAFWNRINAGSKA